MTRVLLFSCAVLAALCILQWKVLSERKDELPPIDYRETTAEFSNRREEMNRVIEWLGAVESRRTGGAQGLCAAAEPNHDGLVQMILDVYVYLNSRRAGASEAQARQKVLDVSTLGHEPAAEAPR